MNAYSLKLAAWNDLFLCLEFLAALDIPRIAHFFRRTSEQLLTTIFHVQVRYAATEIHPTKSARARGAYLRVSFKNTRETAQAINGWKLQRAVKFLENVQEHKEAVPMRRYAGGTGRAAQGTISVALYDAPKGCTWIRMLMV